MNNSFAADFDNEIIRPVQKYAWFSLVNSVLMKANEMIEIFGQA